MTESDKHKQLKLLGRTILKTKGFLNSEIVEERKIKIGNKSFIVDVCGFSFKKSVAVECGTTNPEKLVNLKLMFDEVIHLPYGVTGIQTDFRELIDEQQTQINLLDKENQKLKSKISNQESRIINYERNNKLSRERDLILEALYRVSKRGYYQYTKDDKLIEKIISLIDGERD